MSIEITERAREELKTLNPGAEEQYLRIQVVPGGCSGMTYSAGVESSLREGDEVLYDEEDLKVISDEGSAIYLEGLKIDYSDDLIKSGFRFINPNAAGSCGCGASFAG